MIKREHWGSRLGFILAAAGSAVGLGNIWKFPYMAGENGGGAFLLIYLALVFTIGLSVMLAEMVIGRMTAKNAIGAFAKLKGGAWPLVGLCGVAAAFIILSFYSVVAGWTISYMVKSITGALAIEDPAALGSVFGGFISDPVSPLIYHAIFMALTVFVVLAGVGSGIERASKILMPALFALLLILIVRSVTLPGAGEGIAFLLSPDFSKVTWATVSEALSQAFFSLSLGMGAMITYGSYLSKKENIASSAGWVTLLDTSVAVMAGLLILPAVFAFGFDPSAGPGLTFITLPAVFAHMPMGSVFAFMFFLLLGIAALTSAVSILEVVVAYFVDDRGISRKWASIVVGVIIFLLGIPSSLSLGIMGEFTIFGLGFFDLMDYISSKLLLPIGGLFISLFVGWVVWDKAKEDIAAHNGVVPGWINAWGIIVKFIAPLAIAFILLKGLGVL
ncbi:sodium-dependent transporter [Thalassospira xianhensis]|uniref:Transporter n=1 Tax=Thalassospira xianhensis MCCC 1A02616 TaxID=1177929 RepID=A0A367UJ01_9PROT|nr:sodium-dependent transporter [Thalassospira xianhensis]RCK07284.1 Na+-dependent transporter [Thalassospira xianhensis MCCC 1A02616]UKV13948.1 sodium-dependent transporter [Thalassospiraceae bacterium SW-3-3]